MGPLAGPMFLALLVGPLAGGRFSQEEAPPRSRIVYEVSPIIDLHSHVRLLAQSGSKPPRDLARAVEAARTLGSALGPSFLVWGPIEGQTAGCRTGEELIQAFEELPESFRIPGQEVALRSLALDLARALRKAEPHFLEVEWLARRSRIEAARTRLTESFVPHEAECLAYHLERLGMNDPALAIRVTLTADGPFPGAATYLGADGRGACFVSVDGSKGSQLFETVLHEATHALDVAVGDGSSLGDLRNRLTEAGMGTRASIAHDLPHALMFVQAADSIRRTVAADHTDYGDLAGLFARLAPASEIALGTWTDFLEGRRTRNEALQDMVVEALESTR